MDTGTVESNGFVISSNTDTAEAMTAALAPPLDAAEAPAPATVEAEAAPTAEKPVGKPRNDPRARVEEATGQAAAAKRERDEAIRETAALKARLEVLERRTTTAEQPAAKPDTPQAEHTRYKAMPGFPKLTDFTGEDAFEDWLVAKDLFIADTRFEERTTKAREQAAQQQFEQSERDLAMAFEQKIGATPEDRQAFIESIDPRLANTPRISALPKGTTPTFGNFLVEQIWRSTVPKELALHFTAHPDDVQRLATLHPMHVIREIGKLEAALAPPAAPATGTAASPPKSKASPPIQPVKGSSQSASDEPPGDEASEEAHDAYWSKQRRRFRS